MPNQRHVYNPYIGPFTDIEQVNEQQPSASYTGVGIHPGDIGQRAILTQKGVGTKEYQKVILDSGVSASTSGGVYTAGQTLYWKDKSRYIVTNDSVQAIGGQSANSAWRNEVAGILTCTGPTSGYATWIQQKGNNTIVKSKSLTAVAGYQIVSDTTTAQVDIVAAGTAVGVLPLGKNNTVGAAQTVLNVDLDIPGIP